MAESDKRKIVSEKRLEDLKKARMAAAEKKKQLKEEKLKQEEDDAKNKIVNELKNEIVEEVKEEIVEPVVQEVQVINEVVEKPKKSSKKIVDVPDDFDSRIRNIVKEVVFPKQQKQQKLDAIYEYIMSQKQQSQPSQKQPSKPSQISNVPEKKSGLSLFDY